MDVFLRDEKLCCCSAREKKGPVALVLTVRIVCLADIYPRVDLVQYEEATMDMRPDLSVLGFVENIYAGIETCWCWSLRPLSARKTGEPIHEGTFLHLRLSCEIGKTIPALADGLPQ